MRKTLFAITLGAITAVASAQQQQQIDKEAETRARVDKAAGGLGKVSPQDKAGARVGEGPHKQFKPGGAARRQHDESSSEREAGRGATR